MLGKPITYTDPFSGEKVTETFYFNITPAEMLDIEARYNGAIMGEIRRTIESRNLESIIEIFKYLIGKAYGERPLNTNKFLKSKEITDSFLASDAYSTLMFELLGDKEAASDFFNHVFPDRDSFNGTLKTLFANMEANGGKSGADDVVVE